MVLDARGLDDRGAAENGDACAGVITEAAQTEVEELTLRSIRSAGEMFEDPEQFERLAKYHGDNARWVLRAWVDSWLADAFRDWKLDEDLCRVHCPVLAIHGSRDEYGSARQPQRIVELTPGPATSCMLEDCGHVPHREMPALVLEQIATWLAG